MSQLDSDTICAIVTPPGRSGVGVIRVSGQRASNIANNILGFKPKPRHAHYSDFRNQKGDLVDKGIALYFEGPHSFTGEDVLELQGHGGTQVLNHLLTVIMESGTRLARPGEFSERAFLNNKIDLVQAEAIADLIDASSRQAANSALRTLQGEFSKEINALVEQIVTIRINVEAAIDFSDEDIDLMSDTGVDVALTAALDRLQQILSHAQQGALLKEGMTVVIAGKPNAGKSSLLNALSGLDAAIVTDIPGTTRDLLSQEISIDGLPIHIIDTAGLRKSDDVVEQEGVKRAINSISTADQILLVADSTDTDEAIESILRPLAQIEHLHEGKDREEKISFQELIQRTTIIRNKIDLNPDLSPGKLSTSYQELLLPVIQLSALSKSGIDVLTDHLKDSVGFISSEEGAFTARDRHLEALNKAKITLKSAVKGVSEHSHLELIAEDLRLTQQALGSITGTMTSDDLLGEIFSSFCVGK